MVKRNPDRLYSQSSRASNNTLIKSDNERKDKQIAAGGDVDLYYVTDFFKALWNNEI